MLEISSNRLLIFFQNFQEYERCSTCNPKNGEATSETKGLVSLLPLRRTILHLRSIQQSQKKRETRNTAEKCIPVFRRQSGIMLSSLLPVFLEAAIPFEKIIKAQPDVEDDNGQAFSREPVPPIFVVLFVVI